jgi:low affinity Fe/Cu permease
MRGFDRFAFRVQRIAGTPQVFGTALVAILAWFVSGPVFHWSDGWELVVNTATTIVTFLMGFVVQGALNRQSGEDREQWARLEDRLIELQQFARIAQVSLTTFDDRLADLQEARHDGCH